MNRLTDTERMNNWIDLWKIEKMNWLMKESINEYINERMPEWID